MARRYSRLNRDSVACRRFDRDPPRSGRILDWVLVAIGFGVLLAVPHHLGADGSYRYEALDRLMRGGGVGAARYSLVGPLFATPLYWVGRAVKNVAPADVVAFYNVVLLGFGLLALTRELRPRMPPDQVRALLLVCVFGSMFPNHVQTFYGEVFSALTIAVGVLFLSRRREAIGWSLIVLGTVNTPAMIVGTGLIAIRYALISRRWRHLGWPLVAFAMVMLENWVTRGGPLRTGYANDHGYPTMLPYSGRAGFSYPFFLGLLSIVLSFGKGLVFFAPALFLPLRRSDASPTVRWVHRTLVWFVVGLVLVYARWWSWNGGWFWGPRFFLIATLVGAIPLAVHTSAGARGWLGVGTLVALALSFWAGFAGLVFDTTGLGVCTDEHFKLEALCLYVPEMSTLWHPLVDFKSSVPAKSRYLVTALGVVWGLVFVWTARRLFGSALRDIRHLGADLLSRYRRRRIRF